MLKTLIISTPDSSRGNWKTIWAKLACEGLEIRRYHSRLTAEGMTIVADVMGDTVPAFGNARCTAIPWEVAL